MYTDVAAHNIAIRQVHSRQRNIIATLLNRNATQEPSQTHFRIRRRIPELFATLNICRTDAARAASMEIGARLNSPSPEVGNVGRRKRGKHPKMPRPCRVVTPRDEIHD